MPSAVPDPHVLATIQRIVGRYADGFETQFLFPALQAALRVSTPEEVKARLSNPYWCLHALLQTYAFARRGKDRQALGQAASAALRRISDEGTFPRLLAEPNGIELWSAFETVSRERGLKLGEQLSRGLIQGMLEVAQEVFRGDGVGSIAGWVARTARETGRLEPTFERMVSVRGIGPKTVSTFFRDLVIVEDLESHIEAIDRPYLQPIDRWTRAFAIAVFPELEGQDAPDWVIAGKLSKYARAAKVSAVRLNVAISQFGIHEAHDPDAVAVRVKALMSWPA